MIMIVRAGRECRAHTSFPPVLSSRSCVEDSAFIFALRRMLKRPTELSLLPDHPPLDGAKHDARWRLRRLRRHHQKPAREAMRGDRNPHVRRLFGPSADRDAPAH